MQSRWMYVTAIVVVSLLFFYVYKKYKVAPDIILKDLPLVTLSEEPAHLADYMGKKTLICFAASWCGPCREELEMIHELENNEMKEVQVIVISDEPLGRVLDFRNHTNNNFIWFKMTEPFSSIGINSIPASYVVNTKGEIKQKNIGFVDWKDPSTCRHLLKIME